MDFNFKGRDIINGYDFTPQELCHIMDTAMIYEKRVKSGEAIKDMEGMLVATLFFWFPAPGPGCLSTPPFSAWAPAPST